MNPRHFEIRTLFLAPRVLRLIAVALASPLLVSSGWSAPENAEGLIAHWPMDSLTGSDSVVDAGPRKLDAQAVDVDLVDGRGKKVFAFNGKRSVVYVPDDPVFAVRGDYSVAFWIRQDPVNGGDGPVYAQTSFSIYTFRGAIRVTFRNSGYPGTGYADLMGPAISDGEWHQVTFSHFGESGESFLFVDGVEAARKILVHKPETEGPTTIGNLTRFFLKAELSDMRVYSRPLDAWDAEKLFQQGGSK